MNVFRKRFIINVLASVCILLLTACSAKSTDPSAQQKSEDNSITETAAIQADFSNPQEEAAAAADSSSQPLSTNRKLIRTMDLEIETTDFNSLLSQVSLKIKELGGYIEESHMTGGSIKQTDSQNLQNGTMRARIPADQLDNFIAHLEGQGNITSKFESTTDVTLQYTDIDSRIKSLKIEQERLWELLEKADTLEAVIALEERLSEIRYQLESNESQLLLYDNQVDYSTVNLSIYQVKLLTPSDPESVGARIQHGFTKSLNQISTGLVSILVWLLANSPMLLLVALIIAIIYLVYKKTKVKKLKSKGTHDQTEKT